MYYLVEYDYVDGQVFPGFGGYMGKNGKMIGATKKPEGFRVITPTEYTLEEVFPVLGSLRRVTGKYPVWKEDGSILLQDEPDLEYLRTEKSIQLRAYVGNMLSSTDWVITKLQSLREEGWGEDYISEERSRYLEVLERRKAIREWNHEMEYKIAFAKTVEELEAIKIEFSLP